MRLFAGVPGSRSLGSCPFTVKYARIALNM